MKHFISTAAAIAFLGASAMASPFSPTVSTSSSEASSQQPEKRTLIDRSLNGAMSLMSRFFFSADPGKDDIARNHYYDETETCSVEADAKDDEKSGSRSPERISGPEPIYFGF